MYVLMYVCLYYIFISNERKINGMCKNLIATSQVLLTMIVILTRPIRMNENGISSKISIIS